MRVLFVGSENKYLSMAAELCLKKYQSEHHIRRYKVTSAGIGTDSMLVDPEVLSVLGEINVFAHKHEPKALSKVDVMTTDLIIAMSKKQREHMFREYSRFAPLFNEVAYGIRSDIDEDDVRHNVMHVEVAIPRITQNISKFVR